MSGEQGNTNKFTNATGAPVADNTNMAVRELISLALAVTPRCGG